MAAVVHRSGANQEEPGSEAKLRREPPGDRKPQLRWRGAGALAVTGGLSFSD